MRIHFGLFILYCLCRERKRVLALRGIAHRNHVAHLLIERPASGFETVMMRVQHNGSLLHSLRYQRIAGRVERIADRIGVQVVDASEHLQNGQCQAGE